MIEMALRKVVTEEDEVLRKQSRPVSRIDDRISMLVDDMLQTMHASQGIGLAAVQVGVLRRLFVMDLNDDHGPYVLINPTIIEKSGSQVGQEGCLSVPGCWGDVERPARVVMQALDRDGKPFTLEAEGLLAVCACHEYDHLDGILFKDKVIGELIKQ
jgi:peptide deformylase